VAGRDILWAVSSPTIKGFILLGEKEAASGQISVRSRFSGEQQNMPEIEFVQLAREKGKGMPFRPLALPRLLGQRPVFFG
jgi:threonyl-tRNA synthetase